MRKLSPKAISSGRRSDTFIIMENLSKALAVLCVAVGTMIFLITILVKADTVSKKAKADVQLTSAETDWEGYLYRQAVMNVMQEREKAKP